MAYSRRVPAEPLLVQLRLLQLSEGLTLDELALKVGVTSRTLERLFKARDISDVVADRWASRLGLHATLLWPAHWLQFAELHDRRRLPSGASPLASSRASTIERR